MDCFTFLHTRIAEDEMVARTAASLSDATWRIDEKEWTTGEHLRCGGELHPDPARSHEFPCYVGATEIVDGVDLPMDILYHFARFDPQRVIDECKAKRAVIAMLDENNYGRECGYGVEAVHDNVLRALALPYAYHPDYDPSWAVA